MSDTKNENEHVTNSNSPNKDGSCSSGNVVNQNEQKNATVSGDSGNKDGGLMNEGATTEEENRGNSFLLTGQFALNIVI